MRHIVASPYQKRFALALLLIAVLAIQFWTQSRYPSLNEKAMMSGAIQLEDPLSFEAHYPLSPDMTVWKRIGLSTLNWIHTNERGMTFGVLFGAAFLTLLGYLQRFSFTGRFANSLLGLGIGAPMGVCVNCAAPIAKAMYSGGMRAETTLSAMIASPTMNAVVLTMLFSLTPFYMAATKIGLSLLVILVAVPLLCRFLPEGQLQVAPAERKAQRLPQAYPALTAENPFEAIWRFMRDFALNLWFIVSRTVPLMLVAGFLGAVVATLLPADLLQQAGFGIFSVIVVAVIGTFLPVPIGFDVVAAGALLGSGLDTGFVMALLFTLGSFSIYSYFIIAGAISLRAASMLAVIIMVLGAAGGIGAHAWHAYLNQRAIDILTGWEPSLVNTAHAAERSEPVVIDKDGTRISITGTPFSGRSAAGEKPFKRTEAWKLGIDQPIEFSFGDMWPPFWEGRGITAGDFDRDGDADLVIGSTEKGLYFYRNDGDFRFEPIAFPIGEIASMPVFNVALVDVDNDGWLDLFFTTYQQGNHILPNIQGAFDAANRIQVANRDDAILTLAAAFGDIDRDGDLDAVFGNWAAGWYRRFPGEEARNRLIFNDNGKLDGSKFADLDGMPGETLSVLLSDLDLDGDLDLVEANDFELPDYFRHGDGSGAFTAITRQDDIVPMTTTTTMAVKTGDLSNAGKQDIYMAQIAGRSSGVSKKLKLQSLDRYCAGIEREADRAICERNIEIKSWYKSGHSFDPAYASKCQALDERNRGDCKGMLIKDLAIQNNDAELCDLIPKPQLRARQLCDIHFKPFEGPLEVELAKTVPQILRRNVLLKPEADGRYSETAVADGLEVGGWSWDVKFEDVDNDGDLDVYIVNGTWVPNEVSPSNLFFLNDGTGKFTEQSGPFGLEDYLITASAAAADFDNDGDVDFVTVPVNGPVAAFINNSQAGNAIAFAFDDAFGNRSGIGTRIEVIDSNGKKQMRELQSGGGFMSFDSPQIRFGIGEATAVMQVNVHWSNGGMTRVETPLQAGATYVIARQAVQ